MEFNLNAEISPKSQLRDSVNRETQDSRRDAEELNLKTGVEPTGASGENRAGNDLRTQYVGLRAKVNEPLRSLRLNTAEFRINSIPLFCG